MMLTISISPDAEAKLRERAAASGSDVVNYAAQLLEQAVCRPALDQVLAPVHQEVADSGMSDDEVLEFGRDLLRKVREERKAKAS